MVKVLPTGCHAAPWGTGSCLYYGATPPGGDIAQHAVHSGCLAQGGALHPEIVQESVLAAPYMFRLAVGLLAGSQNDSRLSMLPAENHVKNLA